MRKKWFGEVFFLQTAWTLARTDVDEEGNETRVYPYENMFAHVVGYLSKGSSGLEASENYQLLESHANPLEKLRNEFRDEKNMGDNVITTLNSHMQQIAYDALGDNRGAVIALEPDTGESAGQRQQAVF